MSFRRVRPLCVHPMDTIVRSFWGVPFPPSTIPLVYTESTKLLCVALKVSVHHSCSRLPRRQALDGTPGRRCGCTSLPALTGKRQARQRRPEQSIWRVPNPPGANPLVAERAFPTSDYWGLTGVARCAEEMTGICRDFQ